MVIMEDFSDASIYKYIPPPEPYIEPESAILETEKEIPPELLEALQKLTGAKIFPAIDFLTDIKYKTPIEEYMLDVIDEVEILEEKYEGEPIPEWEKKLLKLRLTGSVLKRKWNDFKNIGIPLLIGVGVIITGLVGYQFSKSYIAEKGKVKARS